LGVGERQNTGRRRGQSQQGSSGRGYGGKEVGAASGTAFPGKTSRLGPPLLKGKSQPQAEKKNSGIRGYALKGEMRLMLPRTSLIMEEGK